MIFDNQEILSLSTEGIKRLFLTLNSWTRPNSYQRTFYHSIQFSSRYNDWITNSSPNSSTDSSIRLWDANKQACIRTYAGHINEKNFVGLTTSADWISCGSEDNAVYTYYKSLSQPVIKFNFGSIDMVTVSINCDIHSLLFQIAYRVSRSPHI